MKCLRVVFGDDARERRLAGAGRPVEDHRRDAVGLDGAAEQLARPEHVRLSREVVEGARAHPLGERRAGAGRA